MYVFAGGALGFSMKKMVGGLLHGRRSFTINLGSEGLFLSSVVEACLWSAAR